MTQPANPEAPYLHCSICSQLSNYHYGFQKNGWEDDNSYLPGAAYQLELVKELKPNGGDRVLDLKQCPECKTYYLYRTDYEFLVGGTEDEQELSRLTEAEAARYLEPPPPDAAGTA